MPRPAAKGNLARASAPRLPEPDDHIAFLCATMAGPLLARVPLPPFFNSAVDGHALRHAALNAERETRLALAGRIGAGGAGGPLAPGSAARIFTGAPMPEGADTVMMQEDARLEGAALRLPPGRGRGADCRPAGEDVAAAAPAPCPPHARGPHA